MPITAKAFAILHALAPLYFNIFLTVLVTAPIKANAHLCIRVLAFPYHDSPPSDFVRSTRASRVVFCEVRAPPALAEEAREADELAVRVAMQEQLQLQVVLLVQLGRVRVLVCLNTLRERCLQCGSTGQDRLEGRKGEPNG